MTTYVESKIITLSSNSAIQKKNGSFLSSVRFELGTFLKDEKDIIHRSITLQSAQIPYSFYVVNYTNNLLRLNNGTTTTYTIPVGNYTATSLITTIKSVVISDYPALTITLNKLNGILTFTNNTYFVIFNNFQHSIGSILGIPSNTFLESDNDAITLTYPLNLLGIKVLEVRSFVLSMNNISSLQSGANNLLASIPVSAVPFGMIDYSDKGNNQMTFTNTSLEELDIEIIDGESNEYINFNNSNWTMTFILHLTRIFRQNEITPFPKGLPIPDLAETNKSSEETKTETEQEKVINFLQQ